MNSGVAEAEHHLSKEDLLRGEVYVFFATMFSRAMDEASWRLLFDWHNQLRDSGFMNPLADWMDGQSKTDQLLQSLSVDFTRLYLGVAKSYGPPPPFESFYRGGSVFDDVLCCYRHVGVHCLGPFGNETDHVVNELLFVAELIRLPASKKPQAEFIRNHLSAWMRPWSRAIEAFDSQKFYSSLIKCLQVFLKNDLAYLESEDILVQKNKKTKTCHQ